VRVSCVFNNDAAAVHLGRELLDLAQHDAADPLPAQLTCDRDVDDAQCVAGDLDCDDRNDVAEELPEQTACRSVSGDAILRKERVQRVAIGGFDRADKET
jgi:hypothetical protein